jgi:hypothetical protein
MGEEAGAQLAVFESTLRRLMHSMRFAPSWTIKDANCAIGCATATMTAATVSSCYSVFVRFAVCFDMVLQSPTHPCSRRPSTPGRARP